MFKKRDSAFTMAEIVIAIALFALFAVGLSQAVYYSLQALVATERKDGSQAVLLRQVREQVLPVMEYAAIEEGGEIMLDAETTIKWEGEVFPTQVLDLFTIEVTVTFPTDLFDQNEVLMNLVVYRPAWSSEFNRDDIRDDLLSRQVTIVGRGGGR